MNTQSLAFPTNGLSGNYLNGEYDGATGLTPDRYLWQVSEDYRNGWLMGTREYYDNQYAEIPAAVA